MYIDSHCHLSKEDYSDIKKIISDNNEAKVNTIVISGCDKNSIKESISLSNEFNGVYTCLGYHPHEASNVVDSDLIELEEFIKNNKKIIAVGEIGLDYYYGKENKEKQIIIFKKQLEIAKRLKKPVVIHSREATKDTLDILKKYDLKGIIHCFSGSQETAEEYIKLGYLLGISGVITFKNSKLGEVVKNVPLEKIVLETDSPYLSPEPYRGKQNSSKNIPIIAKKVAEIKNEELNYIATITSDNVKKMFKI